MCIRDRMKLLRNYMKTCLKTAEKNDMKIRVIGDIKALDEDIKNRIIELEEASKDNNGLNFTIAINYGSRDEMIRAVKCLAQDCVDGKICVDEISDPVYESYLDTHGIPDPDLLIRTSGEQRLSNYLLWLSLIHILPSSFSKAASFVGWSFSYQST